MIDNLHGQVGEGYLALRWSAYSLKGGWKREMGVNAGRFVGLG